MRFSAVKRLYAFLLILLCGLTVLTAEEALTETENPFLADDYPINTDNSFLVALNDDDLFGISDDDLFGGSDDDLFGGSSDDDLFGGSDDDLFGGSDDDLFGSSEDDMFDSMIEEVDAPTAEAPSAVDASAIYDKGSFRAGGSFSIGAESLFTWYEPFKDGNRNSKFIKDGFRNVAVTPVINADFYIDIRPTDIFRFYTKAKFKAPQPVFYPFSEDLENQYPDEDEKMEGSLFEYFVDYNLHDQVFFRLGKHTVTWGVGYFFSPADVINLSAVDPENPTEQREGAISLRTQVVFPGTQNCLWLYVLPDIDEKKEIHELDFDIDDLKYTAFAGKFEFLVDRFEIGIGGWYKYGRTPRAVGTVTGAFRKLSVFSELVLGYGTEELWAPLGKNGSGNVNYGDMKAIFQGTAGFMYTWKDPKLTLIGQYFFNGFGDKKTMDLSIMDFVKLKNAYNYAGRHYLALSLSKQELFTSDCSGSLYGMLSLTDGSGMAQGTFSAKFWDDFTLSTGPIVVFGKKGSEFTRMGGFSGGGSFSWKLSLTYAPDKF